jgi:hypothetical protein
LKNKASQAGKRLFELLLYNATAMTLESHKFGTSGMMRGIRCRVGFCLHGKGDQ